MIFKQFNKYCNPKPKNPPLFINTVGCHSGIETALSVLPIMVFSVGMSVWDVYLFTVNKESQLYLLDQVKAFL